MARYEMKKFPILATVLTLLSLFIAVIAISISLMNDIYDAIMTLGLLVVVGSVLVLAGLTTARVMLLRIISIIITVSTVVVCFFLAIAKYSERDVYLFTISLLMLIASILGLVYFLVNKNERIDKLYNITAIVFVSLVVIYGGVFLARNIYHYVKGTDVLKIETFALVISFALVSILPLLIYRALSKVENKEVN